MIIEDGQMAELAFEKEYIENSEFPVDKIIQKTITELDYKLSQLSRSSFQRSREKDIDHKLFCYDLASLRIAGIIGKEEYAEIKLKEKCITDNLSNIFTVLENNFQNLIISHDYEKLRLNMVVTKIKIDDLVELYKALEKLSDKETISFVISDLLSKKFDALFERKNSN